MVHKQSQIPQYCLVRLQPTEVLNVPFQFFKRRSLDISMSMATSVRIDATQRCRLLGTRTSKIFEAEKRMPKGQSAKATVADLITSKSCMPSKPWPNNKTRRTSLQVRQEKSTSVTVAKSVAGEIGFKTGAPKFSYGKAIQYNLNQ